MHYQCYWVDTEQRTIVRTFNKHDCNIGGLSFHMEWPYRSCEVLRQRIEGKPKFRDERLFIADGVLKKQHFYNGSRFWSDEEREIGNYPIRFYPVSVNFSSHCVTGEDVANNEAYLKIKNNVKEAARNLCKNDLNWYSDRRTVLTYESSEEIALMPILTEAFQTLSSSQIVLSTKSKWRDFRCAKKLYDLYDREIPNDTSISKRFISFLEKVYPLRVNHTPKTLKELKAKCASRFIRRHPTRATTNLLKMLAMKFKGV